MTFMVWNDYLVTGIDIVDQQHRGLVDMLNQAAPVLAQSSDKALADAGPLLDALVNYAVTHFNTEEALMARLAMEPRARDHHHASHARFGQTVGAMVQDFTRGGGVTGDRLLSFLGSWLVLHIMGEDQAMARQIKALESGQPPGEAFLQARGGDLNPEPAALSHAMVDIYSVLTRQNRELLVVNQDLDASRLVIQQHNAHLEEQVRQRTADLEKLADDLRQARDAAEAGSRAKTRFLGTMSHELRTPMNAILGFSRLLRDQDLPGPQKDLAGRIVGASERLLDLLSGIIEYSRLEGGGEQPVAAMPIPLAGLLRDASEMPFAAARAKGLAAGLDLDPALPAGLLGDAALLQRILGIYLGNAVKFTAKGAIRLQARRLGDTADGLVRLRFLVSDTGVGIPAPAQGRLFQPFTQADDSPDRHFEGIGLGLALARELALRLGGQVGVQSEPGKGSHFWLDLTLPEARVAVPGGVAPPARSEALAPSPSPPDKAGRPRLAAGHRQALARLDELLAAYDTEAARLLESLGPGLGATLSELQARVAGFDYDGARDLLQALLAGTDGEDTP
ncbi:MAG: bacteriohemerythrin [Pseudomonadota bacterium]